MVLSKKESRKVAKQQLKDINNQIKKNKDRLKVLERMKKDIEKDLK